MRALVSGANGFIGAHLVRRLEETGWEVVRTQRSAGEGVIAADLANVDPKTFATGQPPVDCVFHLAGRVDGGADAESLERDIVESTRRMFEIARWLDARRFVFPSSIDVLGDVSRHPFRIGDPRNPRNPHADAKSRAELWLESVAGTGPAVTIVRAPPVYGPHGHAGFLRLMSATLRGWPLPLGRAVAPRSRVAVVNLVDLLVRCTEDLRAMRILHVRDDRDYGLADLVRTLAEQGGRRPRLLNVPPGVVRGMLAAVGRRADAVGWFLPAQVDDRAARSALGWTPPVSSETALRETVEWWKHAHR